MHIKKIVSNFVHLLPIFVPSYIATSGIGLIIILILGKFETDIIICTILLTFVLTLFLFWRSKSSFRKFAKEKNLLIDIAIILMVFAWVGINMRYASQSVFITRDPGIYTVAGKWLQSNNTTDIKTVDLKLDNQTARTESSGIWQDLVDKSRNTLQPQGMHLLPAFLGASARAFGEPAIYVLNVMFGGAALMSVYAFSRLILKARYSWLPVTVMAVSLPMIYFSRDTYTEPLAMAFIFAGLTLLSVAIKAKQGLGLWCLAGLVLGAATLARPDSYLVGFAATLGLILFYTGKEASNKRKLITIQGLAVFYLSYCVPAILAIIDIKVLTRVYFIGHGKGIILQVCALIASCLLGLLLYTFWKRFRLQRFIDFFRRNAMLIAIALGIVYLLVFLRPIIYTEYIKGPSAGVGATIEVQKQLGEPIEERGYSELTMEWLQWYFGEALILAGIVGLLIAVYKSLKQPEPHTTLLVSVFTITSLLYLYDPNITPDQIWATRRFLPFVFPGIIILAIYALQEVQQRYFPHLSKNNTKFMAGLLIVSVYLVARPLLVSSPFVRNNEKPLHSKAVHKLCDSIPPNSLVVWLGNTLELSSVQTTRAYCGVESVGYDINKDKNFIANGKLNAKSINSIRTAAESKGLIPFVAIHGSQKSEMDKALQDRFKYIGQYYTYEVQRTLVGPPRHVLPYVDSIEIYELKSEVILSPN